MAARFPPSCYKEDRWRCILNARNSTARMAQLHAAMATQKLDAVLLFAQESMYWLTGYDTFGFCFFQCLVVKADGSMVLLTRSADLRQARAHLDHRQHRRLDRPRQRQPGARPAQSAERSRPARHADRRRISHAWPDRRQWQTPRRAIETFCRTDRFLRHGRRLRAIKSPAEIDKVRRAAELGRRCARRARCR